MYLSIDKICPKSHLSFPKTNGVGILSCHCILAVQLLYHHTGQLQSTLYYTTLSIWEKNIEKMLIGMYIPLEMLL